VVDDVHARLEIAPAGTPRDRAAARAGVAQCHRIEKLCQPMVAAEYAPPFAHRRDVHVIMRRLELHHKGKMGVVNALLKSKFSSVAGFVDNKPPRRFDR
jgi:hypothetical protein